MTEITPDLSEVFKMVCPVAVAHGVSAIEVFGRVAEKVAEYFSTDHQSCFKTKRQE